MIINSSKVKTEALLLFCRDLIVSYKMDKNKLFNIDNETTKFIDERIDQLLSAINLVIQPIDYYLRNSKISRISIILKSYDFITKNITKNFNEGDQFNPSMLCFALLCSWFAELSINEDDKEFIYFSIYPYGEIYDKLLLNISNDNYKHLNILMLNIAEDTINKLYSYRFK
jgi:hypothetical protein